MGLLSLTILALSALAQATLHDDMAASTVACADPADCPAAVGSVVSVWDSEHESHLCTATLVAPDIAITSGHCIEPHLRQPGSACAGSSVFIFPAYNDGLRQVPMERISCASVITAMAPPPVPASEHSDFIMARDYAVVRLARRSARTPLALSRAGMPSEFRGSIYYIDDRTTEGPWMSEIRRHSESAVKIDSFYAPYTSSALAPSAFLFGGLAMPEGASGAPVLDGSGSIRGLINGRQNGFDITLDGSTLSRDRGVYNTMRVSPAELTGLFSVEVARGGNFATNLGCLTAMDMGTGLMSPRQDGSCAPDNERMYAGYRQERQALARRKVAERQQIIESARASIRDQAQREFGGRWNVEEVVVSAGLVELRPVPLCRSEAMGRRTRVATTSRRVSSSLNAAWQPVTTVENRALSISVSRGLDVCSN